MKHEEMETEKVTAKEIIGYLDESVQNLDTQIVARLADARNQAVTSLSARAQTAGGTDGMSHILRLFNDYIHHHRALISTATVCSALFLAFMFTQQSSRHEMMEQSDAFLLGSELPPEAFLDKGFDTWLERTSQP